MTLNCRWSGEPGAPFHGQTPRTAQHSTTATKGKAENQLFDPIYKLFVIRVAAQPTVEFWPFYIVPAGSSGFARARGKHTARRSSARLPVTEPDAHTGDTHRQDNLSGLKMDQTRHPTKRTVPYRTARPREKEL